MFKTLKNQALLVLVCSLLAAQIGQANSFVGNGGNAGDVELMVTKNQILSALVNLSKADISQDSECECQPVFMNKNECELISSLTKDQKKYCLAILKRVSVDITNRLSTNQVKFNWTERKIFVKDDGKTVSAEAVADISNSSVTINKSVFMSLPQNRRILLLTHELLHLVDFENGMPLQDSGSIGPFQSPQGQRQLINSMAAETVMRVHQYGISNQYQSVLKRSQSYKLNWLDFDLKTYTELYGTDNNFNIDRHSGIRIGYKKFFEGGPLGFNLGFQSLGGSKDLLSSTSVEERKSTFSLGLAYRFFLGKDPLTSYGQSFLVFDVNLESLISEYNVKDSSISTNNKESSMGWSANGNYYYPFSFFYFTAGLGLSQHDYTHTDFDLNKNALNLSGNLGVSYGF